MNFLVAANKDYIYPLKVMLTSLLESNPGEHHNVYFLYSAVPKSMIQAIKTYIENKYDCDFIDKYIVETDFADFPVSHHFSIETYYRFLAQNIVPASEDRVLWLDADMIVRKSLKEFYYQEFDGNTLVVCQSINKNPQELLTKLGCPEGTVYFNAGTILFNLQKLRKVTLRDYQDFYVKNKDRITWLDQDIFNAMYARETKVCDYRVYNMQMFSATKFTEEELQFIESQTAILHYIGGIKPWHSSFANPCKQYWTYYENRASTPVDVLLRFVKRCLKKVRKRVLVK